MKTEIYKIETTSDLRLSAQVVATKTTSGDEVAEEKEICLLVDGYDPGSDSEVVEVVTLSAAQARCLIMTLGKLINEVEK